MSYYKEQIEKIARLTTEEKAEYKELVKKRQRDANQNMKANIKDNLKMQLGSLVGGTGMAMMGHAGRQGMLDGTVRRYHNTKAENVNSIKEHGIQSSRAMDADNLTSLAAGISDKDKAGKVYLAKNKKVARGVGTARDRISNSNGFHVPDKLESTINSFKTNPTLKVNIPLDEYNKFTKVKNPELKGANNIKEYLAIQAELAKNNPTMIKANNLDLINNYLAVGRGTDVIQGDIASKYIKGGKGYKGQTLKGVAKHIIDRPKTFAKGVGIAGAGAALTGLGMYNVGKSVHKMMQRNKDLRRKWRDSEEGQRFAELNQKNWRL